MKLPLAHLGKSLSAIKSKKNPKRLLDTTTNLIDMVLAGLTFQTLCSRHTYESLKLACLVVLD